MKIFVDLNISAHRTEKILMALASAKMNIELSHFRFNKEAVSISELSNFVSENQLGKAVFITDKKLEGKRVLSLNFEYSGYANELGGNTAIVSTNGLENNQLPLAVIHEAGHLYGLTHCSTAGCLMAFKLCNYALRYCLNCKVPCKPIQLCNTCKEAFNE